MSEIRINKYIANSGFCSRRKAEEYIKNKKVKLNNEIVSDLATKVSKNDIVSVNDHILSNDVKHVYIMFHKPKGCITSLSDEKNRKTIFSYINLKERIYPVGRLDYDTEGLLLLTNDGDFSNNLTKSENNILKTYRVKIKETINEKELKLLRNGIEIEGKLTKKAFVNIKEQKKDHTILEVSISEGRNRQIRKMFEFINKEVIFLKRIAIQDLRLGGLSRGEYRFLAKEEIDYLKSLYKNKEKILK